MLGLVENKGNDSCVVIPAYAQSTADLFFDVLSKRDDILEQEDGFPINNPSWLCPTETLRKALGCTHQELILDSRLNPTARVCSGLTDALKLVRVELLQGLCTWAKSPTAKRARARFTVGWKQGIEELKTPDPEPIPSVK